MAILPSEEGYQCVILIFQNGPLKAKHGIPHIFFAFWRTAQCGALEKETISSLRYSGAIRNVIMWLLAKGLLLMASNIHRVCWETSLLLFYGESWVLTP